MNPKAEATGTNRPSKHFRLVCWRLLYHVDVRKYLDRQDEIEVCRHARLSLDKWDAEKIRCPKEWTKLLAKRLRRFIWFTEHGSIKDGWTPPTSADRRTANKPIHAYLARRNLTLEEFEAKNGHIRLKSKKYGIPETNWHLYRRIRGWQKE